MRSKLLVLAAIAAVSLSACNDGATIITGDTGGSSVAATKAAACARAGTIRSELAQIQDQIRQAMSGGADSSVWGPVVHKLTLQKAPLNSELVAQNKVCKG